MHWREDRVTKRTASWMWNDACFLWAPCGWAASPDSNQTWRQIVSFPSSLLLSSSFSSFFFIFLFSFSIFPLPFSFITIQFSGRREGNFSFHSGNKLVCYLKVVKEKLEKLSMVLGVGALYNFHATSIYEHWQHDRHMAEWTFPSK